MINFSRNVYKRGIIFIVHGYFTLMHYVYCSCLVMLTTFSNSFFPNNLMVVSCTKTHTPSQNMMHALVRRVKSLVLSYYLKFGNWWCFEQLIDLLIRKHKVEEMLSAHVPQSHVNRRKEKVWYSFIIVINNNVTCHLLCEFATN